LLRYPIQVGDVSERPKVQHSKCCLVKANVGSNPTVTAMENPREAGGFLHSRELRGAFLVHFSRTAAGNGMPMHAGEPWRLSPRRRQDPSP
jgi:hypothetical protein